MMTINNDDNNIKKKALWGLILLQVCKNECYSTCSQNVTYDFLQALTNDLNYVFQTLSKHTCTQKHMNVMPFFGVVFNDTQTGYKKMILYPIG